MFHISPITLGYLFADALLALNAFACATIGLRAFNIDLLARLNLVSHIKGLATLVALSGIIIACIIYQLTYNPNRAYFILYTVSLIPFVAGLEAHNISVLDAVGLGKLRPALQVTSLVIGLYVLASIGYSLLSGKLG